VLGYKRSFLTNTLSNTGLFTGCFMALLAGYMIMAHVLRMYTKHSSDETYMQTVYRILRQASHLRFLNHQPNH